MCLLYWTSICTSGASGRVCLPAVQQTCEWKFTMIHLAWCLLQPYIIWSKSLWIRIRSYAMPTNSSCPSFRKQAGSDDSERDESPPYPRTDFLLCDKWVFILTLRHYLLYLCCLPGRRFQPASVAAPIPRLTRGTMFRLVYVLGWWL